MAKRKGPTESTNNARTYTLTATQIEMQKDNSHSDQVTQNFNDQLYSESQIIWNVLVSVSSKVTIK